MSTMAALHYVAPGEIEWRNVPIPVLHDAGDALVEPVAVAACDLDPLIVRGRTPFPGPFPLGHEFVGRIRDLGDAVTGHAIGDLVLVSFQPSCGECVHCGRGHSASCSSVPPTSMYGVGAVAGDWGGAFADLIRVPYATTNLIGLPADVTPTQAASASDNLADAYRAIAGPLGDIAGGSVLVAGQSGIAAYVVLWAHAFGAAHVTFVGPRTQSLEVAGSLGATTFEVSVWPERFDRHDVTVNCIPDARAFSAVVASTAPQGHATNCAILFGAEPSWPVLKQYMSGIHFHTGRVNGLALMGTVLDAIAEARVDPDAIRPTVVGWDGVADALPEFAGTKLIALR